MTRSNVLFGVVVIACGASLVIAQFTHIGAIFLAATSIFMAMIAAVYSISVAITNDRIRSEERVAASSTLYLSYGMGSIAGPLGGSYLLEAFAPEALFYGFLLLLMTLAVYILLRQVQKPPVAIEDQEQFVPAMPETQVNAEFDPRTEDLPETAIEELFPEPDSPETEAEVDTHTFEPAPINNVSTNPQGESVINEVLETVEDISETFSISESIKQAASEDEESQQQTA